MDASQRATADSCTQSQVDCASSVRESIERPVNVAPSDGSQFVPHFFIVGPPRTGTSWLHEVLRSRAALPVATKETRFFDTHFHRGLHWYRAHFPRRINGSRVGEIAPTYFASGEARERIARLAPGSRVVCIFRNPVERILSLYRVKRAYGLIPWDFEQAMSKDPELLDTSRYASNFAAWRTSMGESQVTATLYDDLRDDPQSYLDTVNDFVGLQRFNLTLAQSGSVHSSEELTEPRSYSRTRNASRVADWLKAQRFDKLVAAIRNSPLRGFLLSGGRPFAEIPDELVAQLYELFRPEVEKLEGFLNRDLTAWKGIAR